FVISGYVISMTAQRKAFSEFAIDRAVRIYIVAIPVLIITAALALMFPEVTGQSSAVDRPVETFLLNAAFLCQSWSLHCAPYLNEAYWSLNYEVMYYAIFAAWFYATGLARVFLVCTLCAV